MSEGTSSVSDFILSGSPVPTDRHEADERIYFFFVQLFIVIAPELLRCAYISHFVPLPYKFAFIQLQVDLCCTQLFDYCL